MDLKQLKNIGLINLTKAQVNLLGHLMPWSVVQSKDTIERGLGLR